VHILSNEVGLVLPLVA